MTKQDINNAIEHCRETIYCAVKDILIQEYDGSTDINITLPTREKINEVFIDYEKCPNGDTLDYVAVISDGEKFSLYEFDLQDMITIANEL